LRLKAGDYFAVLGYIMMNAANEKSLQTIRHAVRDKKKVATVLGFGPRFLHSTGQAYKGGPIAAFSCRLLATMPRNLPVPGQSTPSHSQAHRLAAISPFSRSAAAALCASTWGRI